MICTFKQLDAESTRAANTPMLDHVARMSDQPESNAPGMEADRVDLGQYVDQVCYRVLILYLEDLKLFDERRHH